MATRPPSRSETSTLRRTRVRIGYVDGRSVEASITDWPFLDAEGLDFVDVISSVGTTRISGQSVYWAYREGDHWVVGGAPLGYGQITPEIMAHDEGRQEARQIGFAPDLDHRSVKLGWWWPDEPRRPVD